MSQKKDAKKNENVVNPPSNSFKKILLASSGPIKTIILMWGFLILIIVFIYFNLFIEKYGLFSFLTEKPMVFNTIMVTFSSILFLYWLIVWNDLIKAFFKKDLQNNKSNSLKKGEMNG